MATRYGVIDKLQGTTVPFHDRQALRQRCVEHIPSGEIRAAQVNGNLIVEQAPNPTMCTADRFDRP